MSILYIERKVGKVWSEWAEGTGELSKTKEFTVKITKRSVTKGVTYKIRDSQFGGDLYSCQAGAEKGEDATFNYAGELPALIDNDSAAASHALYAALLAAQKQVTIEIAGEDFDLLKGANYRLCFAKRVGNADYNVVWQAYHDYLETNEFSWTPQYQLFGSNVFQDNITVKVSAKPIDIGLGEITILSEKGRFGPVKTGGPATSLNLVNEYGSIHPGVNQLSTGINNEQISTPIYVAPEAIVTGETNLTPVETVLVWFQQNIETSTMFSSSRSKAVEIDLTNSNKATRLYTAQKWITPG